jgi:hypothetical protein
VFTKNDEEPGCCDAVCPRGWPCSPATHLLSVLSHRLGLTLWQPAVADKTHAIPVLEAVWRRLVMEGRGITVDALLTQRALAERIVQGGGDDGMLIKGNQPQLQHDIPLVFHEAHVLAATLAATRHRIATGATVEPVPPWILSGCITNANSWAPLAASSSSFRFSSRWMPCTTSMIW